MTGYSKLRFLNKKSRSMDFSDLLIANAFPDDQTKRTHEDTSPTALNHARKSTAHEEINTIHEHDYDQDQAAHASTCTRNTTDTSVGAVHLSKNSSVSSETSSHWFGLERQRSTTAASSSSTTPKRGLQSAVKRAFTMRRSSSTSVPHDKYCKIHDQGVAILLENTHFDDEDNNDEVSVENKGEDNPTMDTLRSMKNKKCGSRGKIIRACKHLLGFY